MTNECIPLYDDGDLVPYLAAAPVTGKRFVALAGPQDASTNLFQVGPPQAGGGIEGVAGYDAVAGAVVAVIRRNTSRILPITASGVFNWDDEVQVDSTGAVVKCAAQAALSAPTITLGTAASGGSFAAGTYYWKVTATNSAGETVGSNELNATLTAGQEQPINWSAISGADGYKIYRGTAAGAENVLVATVGTVTTYTDTGSAGSAASVPGSNSTAISAGTAVGRAYSAGTPGADAFIAIY